MQRLRTSLLVIATLTLGGCAHARFAEGYRADAMRNFARTGPGVVEEHEARERVAYVQRVLDAHAGSDRLWHDGWMVGFGALAVGNIVRAFFGPSEIAPGLVGAGGSLLGLTALLLNDEHATHAGDDLRRYLARTDDPWPLRLRVAEQAFRECARVEAFHLSWPTQLARVAVSVGSWAIIALGANRPVGGAINLGAGLMIGQLLGISHPTGLVTLWNHYAGRYPDVDRRRIPYTDTGMPRWAVVPGAYGPQLIIGF